MGHKKRTLIRRGTVIRKVYLPCERLRLGPECTEHPNPLGWDGRRENGLVEEVNLKVGGFETLSLFVPPAPPL